MTKCYFSDAPFSLGPPTKLNMKATFSVPVKFFRVGTLQFMIATFKDGNIAVRKEDIFFNGESLKGR